jgi:hypothetical protein
MRYAGLRPTIFTKELLRLRDSWRGEERNQEQKQKCSGGLAGLKPGAYIGKVGSTA